MIEYHQPPFLLRELKIEVTRRCPLSCIHCSSDASPANHSEMTKQGCLRLLDQAFDLGVKEVVFSGGEPLIWPPIEDVIRHACRVGFDVAVYTSGNIEGIDSLMSDLGCFGVAKCVFSVFGQSAKTHERITRIAGSFRRTLAAVAAATATDMSIELHFVPTADNYRELEGIARLSQRMGISRISILRFVPQGRAHLIRAKTLNRLQNVELRRTIVRLRDGGVDLRTGSPYNFLMLTDQPRCCSAIDRLIVDPELRIYPCDAFKQVRAEDIVGTAEKSSLAGGDLEECWKMSPYLQVIRDYLTRPFGAPCASCKVLDKCLSGCLAQKFIAHGNLTKRPDPDCLRAVNGGQDGVIL